MSSTSSLLAMISRALEEANGDQADFLREIIRDQTIASLTERVDFLEQESARLKAQVAIQEANPSLVWLFRFRTLPTVTTVLIIGFLLLVLYLSGWLERIIALL